MDENRCSRCRMLLEPHATFCTNCGQQLVNFPSQSNGNNAPNLNYNQFPGDSAGNNQMPSQQPSSQRSQQFPQPPIQMPYNPQQPPQQTPQMPYNHQQSPHQPVSSPRDAFNQPPKPNSTYPSNLDSSQPNFPPLNPQPPVQPSPYPQAPNSPGGFNPTPPPQVSYNPQRDAMMPPGGQPRAQYPQQQQSPAYNSQQQYSQDNKSSGMNKLILFGGGGFLIIIVILGVLLLSGGRDIYADMGMECSVSDDALDDNWDDEIDALSKSDIVPAGEVNNFKEAVDNFVGSGYTCDYEGYEYTRVDKDAYVTLLTLSGDIMIKYNLDETRDTVCDNPLASATLESYYNNLETGFIVVDNHIFVLEETGELGKSLEDALEEINVDFETSIDLNPC